MPNATNGPRSAAVTRDDILAELDRVLQDKLFVDSPRSSRFLRYIVEGSTNGDSELKEYTIALEVFDRAPEFDPRLDTIVRVQARRMRDKLEAYYANSNGSTQVVITVPKGSYVPRFRPVGPSDRREAASFWSRIRWRIAAAVVGAILLMAAAYRAQRSAPAGDTFTERALTHAAGQDSHPSLSPDGTRVAYNRSPAPGKNPDIYLKLVDSISSRPVRVTTDPRFEIGPAWSPDGTRLAFARFLELRPDQQLARFQLVVAAPSADASELVLGTFRTRGRQASLQWSPDGEHIAFACHIEAPRGLVQICMYSMETGESWPVSIPSGNVGDRFPTYRGDGGAMAYMGSGKLYVLEMTDDGRARGSRIIVAPEFVFPYPAGWSTDGRRVFFVGWSPRGEYGLWSVEADSSSMPRLLKSLDWPLGASFPYPTLRWIPSGGMRVAYQAHDRESEIMRVSLASQASDSARPLISANRPDFNPEFSPDGARIAFISNRAGTEALYVCDSDGSNQEFVADLPPFAGYAHPRWSPDSTRIAFDAIFRTQYRDLYVVDLASKRVTGLTSTGGRSPDWSRDGKSLYYLPGRTAEIWKLTVASGEKKLVLKGWGSGRIVESHDSRTLYFEHDRQLMKASLDAAGQVTGEPQTIAGPIVSFSVVERGVFAITPAGDLFFYEPARGAIQSVVHGLVETGVSPPDRRSGISVSPDEKVLLFTNWTRDESDLWLIE